MMRQILLKTFACLGVFLGSFSITWAINPDAAPLRDAFGLEGGGQVAGDLYPAADNTYDLGSDSLAWKDLTLDGVLKWPSATQIDGGTNGYLLLQNNAGTGFTGIQFGGITSASGMIRRFNSSGALSVEAADGSGFRDLFVRNLRAGPTDTALKVDFFVGSAPYQLRFADATTIGFSGNINAGAGSTDVGVGRVSAGVLKITDGSMGIGAIQTARNVEANTAVAASPNVITATESFKIFTDEGATAENHHDLPTAAAGLCYTFIVQDADGIQINAATGDTIRVDNSVSAAGGLAESSTIGDALTICAINATEWIAISEMGTWTTT